MTGSSPIGMPRGAAAAARRAAAHPDPQRALARALRRDVVGVVARLPETREMVRWHMPSEIAGRTYEPVDATAQAVLDEVLVPTLRHYAAVLDNQRSRLPADRLALATPEALRCWLVDLTPERCWPGRLVTPDAVAAAWWTGLNDPERVVLAAYVCERLSAWQAMDKPAKAPDAQPVTFKPDKPQQPKTRAAATPSGSKSNRQQDPRAAPAVAPAGLWIVPAPAPAPEPGTEGDAP